MLYSQRSSQVSITCWGASLQCEQCSRSDPVQSDTGLCFAPCFSGPWFTNQPCVQCALGNPTHNSAMVTERMKTSALWQQINGSLSPRIRRTLNKIWHNSIILKQALSKRTVPRRRRRERCCRGTPHRQLKVLTVFVNILNPLLVFPSFTWIHLERGLLSESSLHQIVW